MNYNLDCTMGENFQLYLKEYANGVRGVHTNGTIQGMK